MPDEKSPRRDFLRRAGSSVAVGAWRAYPEAASTHPEPPLGGVYDVRRYGAQGDGNNLDTAAVNQAIEAAAASGGGRVVFPAGSYLCHSLRLKSNVALYLDQNARIIAADSSPSGAGSYDAAEPDTPWNQYQDYGHNHWHNSLLWGEGLADISIEGPGLIWGRGLSKGYGPGPVAEQAGVGNKAISLKNCRNVILRDFSILKGGHFGILATGVDNLTIDNLKIDTDRDGIDLDCCRNVRVSNCTVNSPWDDAICPKSSFALGYERATENVTITNCYVTGIYQLGSVLDGSFRRLGPDFTGGYTGRIKFGTESNGGFRNITISNCIFEGCQGLALETVDGAILEDVSITNITMRDITSAPVFLRLGNRMRGPLGVPVGALRRVLISNIVCSNADPRFGSILSGIPGYSIEDVRLSDVYIEHRGGAGPEASEIQPPESAGSYPEPKMFGPMPSQGFFIRHAKNIEMSNIEIRSLQKDARPIFFLSDVQGARFFRVRAPGAPEGNRFVLDTVEDFEVRLSKPLPDTDLARVDHKKL